MAAQVAVKVIDELPGGGRREAFTLSLAAERLTARELIERRVRHEVEDYNARAPEYFEGLVQPADAERVLNGWRLKRARRIDADEQVAGALAAFVENRILLLVDDRQIETLDEPIVLRSGTEVCFYKLVPLVGG
jgi:hypothetical protein